MLWCLHPHCHGLVEKLGLWRRVRDWSYTIYPFVMEALRTMPSFARRSNLLRALFLGAGCGQGPSSVTTNYVNSFLTVSRLPHVLCPPLFLSIINRVQNIVRTGFGRYDKKSSCSIVDAKNRQSNIGQPSRCDSTRSDGLLSQVLY